jgi:hypothetical protein
MHITCECVHKIFSFIFKIFNKKIRCNALILKLKIGNLIVTMAPQEGLSSVSK